MSTEKNHSPINGYIMLFILLILLIGGVLLLRIYIGAFMIFAAILVIPGFVLVNPNSSRVLLLFGKYIGTIKQNGLFWVNPFYTKKKILHIKNAILHYYPVIFH